jgi:hypothetical protein
MDPKDLADFVGRGRKDNSAPLRSASIRSQASKHSVAGSLDLLMVLVFANFVYGVL